MGYHPRWASRCRLIKAIMRSTFNIQRVPHGAAIVCRVTLGFDVWIPIRYVDLCFLWGQRNFFHLIAVCAHLSVRIVGGKGRV